MAHILVSWINLGISEVGIWIGLDSQGMELGLHSVGLAVVLTSGCVAAGWEGVVRFCGGWLPWGGP